METLLYTVVSLAILGTVLSFAIPKMQQSQERARIETSIASMRALDDIIRTVHTLPPGNSRTSLINVEQGTLMIDSEDEVIVWSIPSLNLKYSEVGTPVRQERVQILTTQTQKKYTTTLTLDFSGQGLNLTLNGNEAFTELTPAPTPYKLAITSQQSIDAQGKLVRSVTFEGIESAAMKMGICGNGKMERGEACDDGDAEHGGGNGECSAKKKCSATCSLNKCPYECGNGVWEFQETCDEVQGCEAGKFCSIFQGCTCVPEKATNYLLHITLTGEAGTIKDNLGKLTCSTGNVGGCSASYSSGTKVILTIQDPELVRTWSGCFGSDSHACLAYAGERCDEGSTSSTCVTKVTADVFVPHFCGNGKVDSEGETCDAGDAAHGGGNGGCPKACGTNCKKNVCNAVCSDSDNGDTPLVGGSTTYDGVAIKDSSNEIGQAPGYINEFSCYSQPEKCPNRNVCLCTTYYLCDKSVLDNEGEAYCEEWAFNSGFWCQP